MWIHPAYLQKSVQLIFSDRISTYHIKIVTFLLKGAAAQILLELGMQKLCQ